jgi:hypothetical protein
LIFQSDLFSCAFHGILGESPKNSPKTKKLTPVFWAIRPNPAFRIAHGPAKTAGSDGQIAHAAGAVL